MSKGFLRRTVFSPLSRLLRRGASPQRLAWSLAIGFVIGVNPIIGSTTLVTIAVAHFCKLNHTAAQLGTHTGYPLQILLLFPFLHAGTLLFGTRPIPLDRMGLVSLLQHHPLQLVHDLWTWEWHALVVWAIVAPLLMPAIALPLRHVFQRTLSQPPGPTAETA